MINLPSSLSSDIGGVSASSLKGEFTLRASASGANISSVSEELDFIFGNSFNIDIDSILSNLESELNSTIQDAIYSLRAKQNKLKQQFMLDSHETQNATTSIKLTSPTPSSTGEKSPSKFESADYSTSDDYPSSHGIIDTVKNWIKVNMSKKSAEIVHPSTSRIQIDGSGNVMEYVTGNRFSKVDGDWIMDVGGNLEFIIGGNKVQIVKGNSTEKTTGNLTVTVNGNEIATVEGTVTETYNSIHNTTVAGVRNEKAAIINHN